MSVKFIFLKPWNFQLLKDGPFHLDSSKMQVLKSPGRQAGAQTLTMLRHVYATWITKQYPESQSSLPQGVSWQGNWCNITQVNYVILYCSPETIIPILY